MQVVIKSADVSNEARPPEVSLPWMRKLFEEFGKQYDREVEVGIKETPFMNIKTVSKPSAQIGFIKYVRNLMIVQWRRQDFAPGEARRACSRYPAEITEIST